MPLHPTSTATSALAIAVPLLLLASIEAQTRKVLPPGFAEIEGNRTHTAVLGRPTSGLQTIHDSVWVTQQSGVLMGIRFRPQGEDFGASLPGYNKPYQLTAGRTVVSAAGMSTDPVLNHGGAQPTVVFAANLSVPTSLPQSTAPRPFAIHLPFNAPFVYDGSQGNLILTLTTTDATSPPGRYGVDAVHLRSTSGEGIVEPIAEGCMNAQGAALSLAIDDTPLTYAGMLNANLSSSAPGSFPTAVLLLGFRRVHFDLTPLGMTGCVLETADAVTATILETGGVYPPFTLSIPNVPAMTGGTLFAQAAGFAQVGTFAGAVTSEALGLRVGSATGAMMNSHSIFTLTQTAWFMGATGTYIPVIELDGIFP